MKNPIVFLCLNLVTVSAFAAWTDTIKLKGDFRFRNELIDDEVSGAANKETFRQRIRLRVGINADVNEEISIKTRIATGDTGEITSTNETLSGYSNKKDIVLDLAYFNWKAAEDLNVMGGKIPVPFNLVGGSDLYYDSDLSLEGLAVQYNKAAEKMAYKVNLGYSWLEEVASTATPSNSDALLLGGQLAVGYKDDNLGALLSVAQYAFTNLEGRLPVASKGNTLAGLNYASDYYLMVYGLELAKEVNGLPVVFFAEMVENTEADQNEAATIYGLKVGKTKEKKDWAVSVDYRDTEADSVLGVYSDSDFADGETNSKGVRVVAQYMPSDRVVIGATHIMSETDVSTGAEDYTRSMLDFIFAW